MNKENSNHCNTFLANDCNHISKSISDTKSAIELYEVFRGETDLSLKFKILLDERGLSLYDRTIKDHFTGSVLVVNNVTKKTLLTLHPRSGRWQQLGGHGEGENNPLTVSAREAVEESGIHDLSIFECPILIAPHEATGGCRTVPGEACWHYDICYLATTDSEQFETSDESLDLQWHTFDEVKNFVKEGSVDQRVVDMMENAVKVLE